MRARACQVVGKIQRAVVCHAEPVLDRRSRSRIRHIPGGCCRLQKVIIAEQQPRGLRVQVRPPKRIRFFQQVIPAACLVCAAQPVSACVAVLHHIRHYFVGGRVACPIQINGKLRTMHTDAGIIRIPFVQCHVGVRAFVFKPRLAAVRPFGRPCACCCVREVQRILARHTKSVSDSVAQVILVGYIPVGRERFHKIILAVRQCAILEVRPAQRVGRHRVHLGSAVHLTGSARLVDTRVPRLDQICHLRIGRRVGIV